MAASFLMICSLLKVAGVHSVIISYPRVEVAILVLKRNSSRISCCLRASNLFWNLGVMFRKVSFHNCDFETYLTRAVVIKVVSMILRQNYSIKASPCWFIRMDSIEKQAASGHGQRWHTTATIVDGSRALLDESWHLILGFATSLRAGCSH